MSTIKRIAKNTTFIFLSSIIAKIFAFILIVAIARYLGDDGLGQYAFIYAFSWMFAQFSDLGLNTLIRKHVARNEKLLYKYVNNISTIFLTLGFFVFIITSIVGFLLTKSLDIKLMIVVASFSILFERISNSFRAAFYALQKMEYEAVVITLERFVALILGLGALILGFGLKGIIFAYFISYFSILLSSFLIYRFKFAKLKLSFDFNYWKYLIKMSLPFWFTTLFIFIYFRIDIIMLSLFKGDAVVGWYEAAYNLILALLFIPTSFVAALFPVMSKLYTSSKQALKSTYKKAFRYLIIIAFPIAVGTTLLSGRIIYFIYRKDFLNTIPALQILIWAGALMFLTYLLGYVLNSIDKQKTFMWIAGTGALFNILANLYFIPAYSHIGAAITTLMTEFIIFVLLFYYVSKYLVKNNFLLNFIKLIFCNLIMGGVVYLLSGFHLIFIVVIAVIVYFGFVFITRILYKKDLKLVKGLFQR
ncbi:MAG: flippase, partial [Promethearchaeota archaeon]